MSRLIISAVANDFGEVSGTPDLLTISASVSDAVSGAPISGLTKTNFKVKFVAGAMNPDLSEVSEFPANSGFYNLRLLIAGQFKSRTVFGVMVTLPPKGNVRPGTPDSQGQTVVILVP